MWPYLRDYVDIAISLITPQEIQESVLDINLDRLFQDGYNTLILDIDNTVVPRSEKNISVKMQTWVESAKQTGFNVYFLSNNSSCARVLSVCEQTHTQGFYFACKPLAFSAKDLAQTYGIDLSRAVFVGDQLFTDVIVGNWLKAYPILVDPMDKKLSFIKTLQRQIELYIIEKWQLQ